jgi:Mn2+/Fe2+ NRAMP family transporter
MAWRAAPGLTPVLREAAELPIRDSGYLYLLAANIGTGIMPWTLLYQQSASVDKGLGARHIRAARIETMAGVLLCQTITIALLITAAATLGGRGALITVDQIETAFTATLGAAVGRVVFALGLSGGALVAAIVVCLTFAWTMGEVLGVRHSLEHHPRQAPGFYATLSLMLIAAGTLVASGIDLVGISIAAGVTNALLLPLVLLLLYSLSRVALPASLRLRGGYGMLVAVSFLSVAGIGLCAAIVGVWR